MSQTITAAAIRDHVLPALSIMTEEAVSIAVGDDLAHIGQQAERIATALETIAGHLAAFNPN